MRALTKKLAAMSTLALIGVSGAQASIISGSASGGSEAVATFVNANGDSISLDLGEQMAAINNGDNYSLSAEVLSFIAAAGGPANITYGIIAGSTTARTYLTSSASFTFADDQQVANSAKSLWASSLNGFIQNLNQGDATPPATNLTYGSFLAGTGSPNYIDGGHDNWQSGDFAFSNLGAATDPLLLYTTTFSTSNIGLVNFTLFKAGLYAKLDFNSNQLQVIPVPAAVWLFGSAMGLLGVARRRAVAA
ncbi:MAG: VPLPA-CTERM sorting domain-containing protein [Gammaproteobacteria bacterium]|nr:VPLPA-CTERM sorting domain-containing protein [Gammaproteobacteria bacterium]